jgi:hypothetical protein
MTIDQFAAFDKLHPLDKQVIRALFEEGWSFAFCCPSRIAPMNGIWDPGGRFDRFPMFCLKDDA